MSVRLDRLQRGLYEALSGVTDVVAWGYGQQPREAGGLLSLRVLSGPALDQRHARGTLLLPGVSLIVRVDEATEDRKLIIRLNGFDYGHEVEAGETVTDIRDDLLAQIQAGEAGHVTATGDGADGIALSADYLGAIRSLAFVGGDLSAESVVISEDAVLVTEGHATFSIEMQAFARGREPRNGAINIITAALDRLQSPAVSATLDLWGFGLQDKGVPIDISAIAGTDWESRASCDFTVSAVSVGVEPVDQIETVTSEFSVSGLSLTATQTAA